MIELWRSVTPRGRIVIALALAALLALPLAADRAPFSQSLIADDERTFLASAELLGGPTVPSVGIATCFTGDSGWHTRLGPAIPGLTIWLDLESRTASTGALQREPLRLR